MGDEIKSRDATYDIISIITQSVFVIDCIYLTNEGINTYDKDNYILLETSLDETFERRLIL